MKNKVTVIAFFCLLALSCTKQNPAEPVVPKENGFEYVDLGLSVKWAAANVGASSAEQLGDFFAWGETMPQHSKEYSKHSYSYKDSPSILPAEADAATANMGGKWRTPSKEEFFELKSGCNWLWVDQYNGMLISGYIISGKKPGYQGQHIFLPAAGWRENGLHLSLDVNGLYWTQNASTIYIINSTDSGYNYEDRFVGLPVRAVFK
ncbi:MAG: hypothetical protein MJY83_02910 [Bacteroidales bacterium]|nr:hypothetical protein [Bacteroidales bacterium]